MSFSPARKASRRFSVFLRPFEVGTSIPDFGFPFPAVEQASVLGFDGLEIALPDLPDPQRQVAGLEDMQDRFGELNDIIVHEKLATGIATTLADRPPGPVRRAFAAGLLTGHEEARFKPVLIATEHTFRAFEKLKPYWR
jgi:hypothetical protein